MQLSKREIQILLKLIELENSITTKELAELFSVSIRTIKYDLDNIRDWLKSKQITLHSQRSKGIWFDLSTIQKMRIKNELLDVERFETYADQTDRISRIVLELLLKEEYITTAYLSKIMGVSTSTVVNDLDNIDSFLKKFQVSLNRRSGYGLMIIGEEINLRLLMEHLLQVELTEYDIYKIMDQLINPLHENTINIISVNELNIVYQQVIQFLSEILNPSLLHQFDYAELLSLSLRTAIAVCRMKLNVSIESFQLLKNTDELNQVNDVPFLLMNEMFSAYDLPLLEDEYHYISSHLTEKNEEYDTFELTQSLIKTVSNEFNFPFYKDNQLLTNLFTHLSLRLGKKQTYANEYNPFVDEIRKEHIELFRAIEIGCLENLENWKQLINDSFISYVTLHFLVSFEKQRRELISVVYVCSTGLGVTNLIQQRVHEEVPDVKILGFASVLNYEDMIKEKKPDLVISIFPLEVINCPIIKVNAIPSKEDIERIRGTVQYLLDQEGGRLSDYHMIEPSKKNPESEIISQDLIVKGYVIYESLLKILSERFNPSYQEAFLLHTFLMVHRIVFNKQYALEGNVNQNLFFENHQLIIEIEQLFSENDLSVNYAELTALLQYID